MSKPLDPDEEEARVYGKALIAAFKAVLLAVDPGDGEEFFLAVNAKDPRLAHYGLCAQGDKEKGLWYFSLSAKGEADEEGPIGHA